VIYFQLNFQRTPLPPTKSLGIYTVPWGTGDVTIQLYGVDEFVTKSVIRDGLKGSSLDFTLKFLIKATDFQENIYRSLIEVPMGSTITYKDLASKAGSKAYRAVGTCMAKNPLPPFIPCHRVFGSHGSLGGYNGGLDLKHKLLGFEGYKQLSHF
jgi:O-6-methylguanine DNA methyltransferase